MAITTADIAQAIAGEVNKELSVSIEMTCRGERDGLPLWTVNGSPADADAAAAYLVGLGLMTEESRETFQDEDAPAETFVYLKS